MFLTLSALAFTFALAVFVYFFDNFMGASDTADIAAIMAGMHDRTSWLKQRVNREAAGSRRRKLAMNTIQKEILPALKRHKGFQNEITFI